MAEIRWVTVAKDIWFFKCRKWWPVYWPSHCDPEISENAANPHCHVAWNRVSEKTRQYLLSGYCISGVDSNTQLGARVMWANNIVEVKERKRDPIISSPCSLHRTSFPEMKWWAARTRRSSGRGRLS